MRCDRRSDADGAHEGGGAQTDHRAHRREDDGRAQQARRAQGKPGTAYTSIWEEPDETDEEGDLGGAADDDARSETGSLLSYGTSDAAD